MPVGFAEAVFKGPEPQFGIEQGQIQSRALEGGVELAQGVGLRIGSDAEQEAVVVHLAQALGGVFGKPERAADLHLAQNKIVELLRRQPREVRQCFQNHRRPDNFRPVNPARPRLRVKPRNDLAGAHGEFNPVERRRCAQHFLKQFLPARVGMKRGRAHLRQRAVNVKNHGPDFQLLVFHKSGSRLSAASFLSMKSSQTFWSGGLRCAKTAS
jgi:hypothetical protein